MEQEYKIRGSGSVTVTISLDDQMLKYSFGFMKKEIQLSSISRVKIYGSNFSGTANIKIFYNDEAKEKKLPVMNVMVTDQGAREFLKDFKEKVGGHIEWINPLAEDFSNLGQEQKYDVSVTKFGGGLSRGVQITIYYGIFAILVIPLLILIYVTITDGYRITTSARGVKVKKIVPHFIPWENLMTVEIQRLRINTRSYGHVSTSMNYYITFIDNEQKRYKVLVRALEAMKLVKELTKRNKMNEEYLKDFIC